MAYQERKVYRSVAYVLGPDVEPAYFPVAKEREKFSKDSRGTYRLNLKELFSAHGAQGKYTKQSKE